MILQILLIDYGYEDDYTLPSLAPPLQEEPHAFSEASIKTPTSDMVRMIVIIIWILGIR